MLLNKCLFRKLLRCLSTVRLRSISQPLPCFKSSSISITMFSFMGNLCSFLQNQSSGMINTRTPIPELYRTCLKSQGISSRVLKLCYVFIFTLLLLGFFHLDNSKPFDPLSSPMIIIISAIAGITLKSELCNFFQSTFRTGFEYLLKHLDILYGSEYKREI